MKFTLRDLIWATLVAALVLVIGINVVALRTQKQELQEQVQQVQMLRHVAKAYAERASALEDVLTRNEMAPGKAIATRVMLGKTIDGTVNAKCVRVVDGDTIVCLDKNNQRYRVRLESIDCPELGEPFSSKSKEFTENLCYEKTVTLYVTGENRLDRTLAFVLIDGKNVSVELLKAGLARHYTEFSNDETLAGFEDTARKAGVGMWDGK